MNKNELYRSVIITNANNNEYKKGYLKGSIVVEPDDDGCQEHFYKIYLLIENDKIIDVSFSGTGCSISSASISLLLQYVRNKTINHTKKFLFNYLNMIFKKEYEKKELGDLIAFENIWNFPNRIDCAAVGAKTILKGINVNQKK